METLAKVGAATVNAMSSQPLAIGLLVVNIVFLGFSGYILSQVAANAKDRNMAQMQLIEKLVHDCAKQAP